MPDSPIRVDFLAPDSHGLPGRLGLTIAPGKWRPGLDHASDTLVRDDLLRLRDFHGAKVLVTLLEEIEGAAKLVDDIVDAMSAGENVVVHCRGGLGRSGTIAACFLVARGRAPGEAIRLVRSARPGAVEVRDQEDFVQRFREQEFPVLAHPADGGGERRELESSNASSSGD